MSLFRKTKRKKLSKPNEDQSIEREEANDVVNIDLSLETPEKVSADSKQQRYDKIVANVW